MTDISQIALEFCREVLGWSDASAEFAVDGVIWNGKSNEQITGFRFDDLNGVMEAVRGWCDTNNAVIETSCAKDSVVARVRLLSFDGEPFWQHCDTLQEALLAACVDASRKLKAADRTSYAGSVSVPTVNR
ncbi:hypothetical protein J8F10_08680 [Gemmata sp. G18]|uniref:Phage ABA sandwich domain-containing protein n=1 Tax=Gemmata palustris TaxID=2822762 RepID=A0ABS5BNQ0_9BACT|nr:hypothetical protein [Gemmata palustris]MBP3955353.1 hypothetical protein [Gemmata palustris]